MTACSLRRHHPRQQPDLERERPEALAERRLVLGGQHGRRDEDRDLLAVLGRLERGAQSHLRLAIPDIADDEPVHRLDLLHVRLDLGDGSQLVDGLLVRERGLHLRLPRRVQGEGVAAGSGSGRIELEQLLGEFRHGLADTLLGA